MNYLAHLALVAPEDRLMVGGFVGDFIKGPLSDDWDDEIARGILLHRAVDAFSDQHAELRRVRELLPDNWRRFAGILVDMLLDHYLASRWEDIYEQPLDSFVTGTEISLRSFTTEIPEEARRVMERLFYYRWLDRYADLGFTLNAIAGIGQRMRFENPLHESAGVVEDFYDELCESCGVIYAEAELYVAEWLSRNPSGT